MFSAFWANNFETIQRDKGVKKIQRAGRTGVTSTRDDKSTIHQSIRSRGKISSKLCVDLI